MCSGRDQHPGRRAECLLNPQSSRTSPSDLGVFVCAKRAPAADEADGGSAAAGNSAAARQLGSVRKMQPLRACAPEIDCTPVVAGNKAQGRHSVVVWLTSSAVLMYVASNQLHSSPLVQSIPMHHTSPWRTFHRFVTVTVCMSNLVVVCVCVCVALFY